MKNSAFLAYNILNSDTKNNINNEIAKYMNDTTKELQRNKRQKKSLENERSKGEQKIFYLCKNLLKLIEKN